MHDCATHHGDPGGPLLRGEPGTKGLILGINVLGYPSIKNSWRTQNTAVWPFLLRALPNFSRCMFKTHRRNGDPSRRNPTDIPNKMMVITVPA